MSFKRTVRASTAGGPSGGPSVFGVRMREARQRLDLPQDKLGVLVGIDEHCASARMSRYENGVNEPPIGTARLLAAALKVPLAYLYCDDDLLAQLVLAINRLSAHDKQLVLTSIERRLREVGTLDKDHA
jgi:transcriptional regulator with XRE-family HTH domain